MTQEENLTIRRILKVNHAGECGAVNIYRAQIFVCRLFHPALLPFLTETLSHELVHRDRFRAAMPARKARPCGAMPLWGVGGYALGFATAVLGANAVMICTAAVERTVHIHLQDQMHFLKDRDTDLHALIASIETEELGHLTHAQSHMKASALSAPLDRLITLATETVIFLSTQGDVARMARALRR